MLVAQNPKGSVTCGVGNSNKFFQCQRKVKTTVVPTAVYYVIHRKDHILHIYSACTWILFETALYCTLLITTVPLLCATITSIQSEFIRNQALI